MSSIENETEQRIQRIRSHAGIRSFVIFSKEGVVIRSTTDGITTTHLGRHLMGLVQLARHVVRDLDPLDDLQVVRLRTNHNEILMLNCNSGVCIAVQAFHSPSVTQKDGAK